VVWVCRWVFIAVFRSSKPGTEAMTPDRPGNL